MRNCGLTAEEVLQCLCATEYERLGNYQETAQRLGLDRRTVRIKVKAWKRRQRGTAR